MSRYDDLIALVDSHDGHDCLIWPFAKSGSGYGHVWLDGRHQSVHRVAYELTIGPIPEGLQIDHLCRNRTCFNPRHLEPVAQSVNIRRGVSFTSLNASKTHCPAGHPYSGPNLRVRTSGRRACRACDADYQRRYDETKRQAA
jgi:hypothetical protein